MGREALLARYPTKHQNKLGYSPGSSRHLKLIQNSPLRLDDTERQLLEANGFALSRRAEFPSFAMAYLQIYKADLPVYVSADAILHAWHRAYDTMLIELETDVLVPALERLLAQLESRLPTLRSEEQREDLGEYLAVAEGLRRGFFHAPGHGSRHRVERLFDAAMAASGVQEQTLFGRPRSIDFSQYKPRGHYTRSEELTRYFRAMMWLGRIDFRAEESRADASQRFDRRQLEDAVALRQLFDPDLMGLWRAMDAAMTVFVGMHDSMTLADMTRYLWDLGAPDFDLGRFSDATLRDSLRAGGYGKQRIMSHLTSKQPDAPELPTNTSFALFGQRYALDSHVLHAVTEDRVPGRPLPDALDVGFAAFGNNDAAVLLGAGLERYAGQLASMRKTVDAQKQADWTSSLYGAWLWALRGLSPDADERAARRPGLMRTEPWARRLLNTALGSWSELRHDTILYAKQSYSVSIVCEFPDVYVDPYPAVYERLRAAAKVGRGALAEISRMPAAQQATRMPQRADAYFVRFEEILRQLQQIAEKEVAGEPLASSDLEFVNGMIESHRGKSVGCGPAPTRYDGWYVDLLYGGNVHDPDLTVADVHTAADSKLEVAKGRPRRMVVSLDTPQGLRSFVGAVFSFHQFVSEERLDDQEWSERASSKADVSWMRDIVAHSQGDGAGGH